MRISKDAVRTTLLLVGCVVMASILALVVLSWPSEDDAPSDGIEIQISPVPSPTSSVTTKTFAEQFQGGCPPDGAVTGGEVLTNKPSQRIDPRLFDLMQEEVEDSLGETHRFVQKRAFCLFTDDGRVKGVLNSYYARVGQLYADPLVVLAFWLNKRGIDVEATICQIEWVWSESPCGRNDPVEEVPQESEEQQEPEKPLEGDHTFA